MRCTTGRIIGLFPTTYRTRSERFWSIGPATISGGRFNKRQLECGTLKLERIDPTMVRDLGEGSTDEMVLGFLRAEMDSPQYRSDYAKMLDSFGFDRSALIDKGDLTDTYANHVRAIMLSMVRGYGRNVLLFHRFPKDVKWRHVSFDPSEFHRLRYVGNQEFWMELTQGTRLIDDGARNYNGTQIEAAVDAILENMRRGDTIPEIILVDDNQNRLVVIEGNRRVTAFAIARPNEVRALLGRSPTMDRWHFI